MPCHSKRPQRLSLRAAISNHAIPRALVMLLTVSALGTGCATRGLTPDQQKAQIAFPLQATSQQTAPYTPAPVSPPSADGPLVSKPWMEEQLRKFDDRYAQSATEIKGVFEQSVATMKSAVTPADLKPLTAGIGKVGGDLTALSGRFESMMSALQSRIKDLERLLNDAKASSEAKTAAATANSLPDAPTPDADSRAFNDALKGLQGTPRQTLPLRAWFETHPQHPKAPEALFQLGLAFLDAGYPSAAKLYLKRLVDEYATSPQAAEATALVGLKPTPKHAPKPAKPATAKPASPAAVGPKANTPDCGPKVVCPPSAAAAGQGAKPDAPPSLVPVPMRDLKEKAPTTPGKNNAELDALTPKGKQPEKSTDTMLPMPGSAQTANQTPAALVPSPPASPEIADTRTTLIPATKRLK